MDILINILILLGIILVGAFFYGAIKELINPSDKIKLKNEEKENENKKLAEEEAEIHNQDVLINKKQE